jgi:hypothetical protein
MEGRSMNALHTTLKCITKLGLILMLGSTISACSSSMRWKEEVTLHDGQIVIEERYVKLGGYLYLDSTERTSLDETATFILPKTKKRIVWTTDFRDSEPEPNSLNMIRFDVVNGIPYLATYPAGCIAYNKWGRPNPPQILFKYESEQWKRIAVDELPPELIGTTANVIVGTPASSLLKSFYNVDDVNAKNYYVRTPEYKTILREPVKGGDGSSVNCPDFNSQQYRSFTPPLPIRPLPEK